METIMMSSKEISRLEVMQKLSEKRMSQKEAGAILGVSERHIKRLLKAYRKKGADGLISKHRERKGKHACQQRRNKRCWTCWKANTKDLDRRWHMRNWLKRKN